MNNKIESTDEAWESGLLGTSLEHAKPSRFQPQNTLIERLLAQASKESNELAELLEEAAEALQTASKEEPVGTYESITDVMLQLRNGTIGDQQVYEVIKDKPLFTGPIAQHPGLSEELAAIDEPRPIAWANPDDMLDVGTSFRWIKIDEFTMPVFTSPPKKDWVGLTYEEIDALLLPECAGDSEMHDFAREVEAKLKEKNA